MSYTENAIPQPHQRRYADGERPIRVCHLASSNWGARWMVEQLVGLRDQYGYEVAAVINEGPGPLLEHLEANGIKTYGWNFGIFGRRDAPTILGRLISLGRLFKHEQFDVVQSHLLASLIMCRLAAWLVGVPVRLSMIPHPSHLEATASRWIEQQTHWMDTGLIASCEYTADLYRGIGVDEDQLALIYYGPDATRFVPENIAPVDLRPEFGWGPETRLVGNVAFFYWRSIHNRWAPPDLNTGGFKGQEDLIRAAPLVLREFPETRFLLIGSAPDAGGQKFLDEMQALVRELGLEEKVVFPGYRADTPGIIRSLEVSIQAAHSENLGGTVESLLLERPMVATRAGGMGDSVRDGETGVLVDYANPASLAEGVLRLLRDPQRAQQLGQAGRKLMLERFTLERTLADLDALYKKQLYAVGKRKAGYSTAQMVRRAALFIFVGLKLWLRIIVVDKLVGSAKNGWRRLAKKATGSNA